MDPDAALYEALVNLWNMNRAPLLAAEYRQDALENLTGLVEWLERGGPAPLVANATRRFDDYRKSATD